MIPLPASKLLTLALFTVILLSNPIKPFKPYKPYLTQTTAFPLNPKIFSIKLLQTNPQITQKSFPQAIQSFNPTPAFNSSSFPPNPNPKPKTANSQPESFQSSSKPHPTTLLAHNPRILEPSRDPFP